MTMQPLDLCCPTIQTIRISHILIGGLIGYLGTKRVSKWIGDRLGINTSSNEDSKE